MLSLHELSQLHNRLDTVLVLGAVMGPLAIEASLCTASLEAGKQCPPQVLSSLPTDTA